MVPDTSPRRFLVNTGVTAFTSAVNFFLGFLVLSAARQSLGDAGLGVWSLAMGLLVMSPLIDFGLGAALGIVVARHAGSGDGDRLNEALNAYASMAFPLAAVVTFAGVFASPWLADSLIRNSEWNGQAATLFAFVFGVIGMQIAGSLIGGVLIGYQLLSEFRIWNLIWQTVKTLGIIWLLHRHADLHMIGWWLLIGSAGFIVTAWSLWMKRVPVRMKLARPSRAAIRELWHAALPLQLNRLAGSLLGQVDKFVLALFVGAVMAGWYELSARLAGAILYLPGFMLAALAPAVAAISGSGAHDRALDMMRLSSRYLNLLVFPLAGFLWLYAPPLLHWWVGDVNGSVVISARVLLGMFFLLVVQQPMINALLGMGKQHVVLRFSLIVVLLNVPVSAILVWHYGFLGACWGSLTTVVIASALFFAALFRERIISAGCWKDAWLRPMPATAITILAMGILPLSPGSLPAVIKCLVVGGTLYFFLIFLTKAITMDDIKRFRAAWESR